MKIVRYIGNIIILLVFLFGITGITVFHHICNSSNQETVTVYPELSGSPSASCCEDDATAHVVFPDPAAPQKIDPSPCCKSISSYLKLNYISERTEKLSLILYPVQESIFQANELTLPDPDQSCDQPVYFQFYSPPHRYGRQLIQYLHQIKIPAHHELA